MSIFVIFLFFSCNFHTMYAEEQVLPIGKAKAVREIIHLNVQGLDDIEESGHRNLSQIFLSVVKNDFLFYKKLFHMTDRHPGTYDLVLNFSKTVKLVEVRLYQVSPKALLYQNSFNLLSSKLRRAIHAEMNDLYRSMTGKESFFNSQIFFISDRDSTKSNFIKELYMMDFDGYNKRRLTFHGGIVLSPGVSEDGRQVLYSLIPKKNRKNINLRMLDRRTSKNILISSKKGMNTGAIFSKQENHIYLTLSYTGNAEIFDMNIKDKTLRKITKHYSLDVDPSLNHDGTKMTFLSGRSGKPMIFTADTSGTEKNIKRINYAGKFNATPRFSPDGQQIVFSSWVDSNFDLFRMNVEGDNLMRLTKGFKSNEEPTYSPDGQFIAFSSLEVISNERSSAQISIIDTEGGKVGTITDNFGHCTSPRWSKGFK